LRGGVDVRLVGARKAADHRAFYPPRDLAHGVCVARRGDREAGLDHVDAQAGELLGDLDLLLRVQGDAGRLLAVPQGGVEDVDAVAVGNLGHSVPSLSTHDLPPSLATFDDLFSRGYRAAQRLLPPEGEEKEERQAVEPVGHEATAE